MNYATRKTPTRHDKRCSAPECDLKMHARGLCQKHYKQRFFDRRTNCVVTSSHHTGVVPVRAPGWGSRPYWDVPF